MSDSTHSDLIHIVCPGCNQVNRLPKDKLESKGKCGNCQSVLLNGAPVSLGLANFKKHIFRNDLPVLVDFWAPWCEPCKMMSPVFAQAAQQLHAKVLFVKVDTEAEQALANQYGIRSIPTIALYKQGTEVARIAGAMDFQNFIAWLNQNIQTNTD